MTSQDASYEDAYRELKASYAERLRTSVETINATLAKGKSAGLSKTDLINTQSLAHGLAGSAKTFGFEAVSGSARKVDVYLGGLVKTTADGQAMKAEDFKTLENLLLPLCSDCTAGTIS